MFALIPTIIHSYGGGAVTDGRSVAAIPNVLTGYRSAATDRNPGWGKRRFDSSDWMERTFADEGGRDAITLTVVRSLDAKRLYHHPELAVAYGTGFVGKDVRRFAERPDIPVHVLKAGPGVSAAGLYVLHYGNRFIDNPVIFQIRTAGELLFSRRQPMTLFFLLDSSPARADEAEPTAVLRLLFAAIDAFSAPNVP
jgi:hypothetical protein